MGHTSETDYMVVPPDSAEWYGVCSTYISLSQSGAAELSVQEACSDGSTRSLTIPGGGTGAWSQSGFDSQYSGKACLYSASAPFNVHSWADADGGDAVNLLPTSTGSTAFGTSTQFEWLSFASLESGSCSCSHGEVAVDSCANGVCKGRIGGGGPGVTCDCTVPMWGVMECAETHDEQLFYGDLAYESAMPTCGDVEPECMDDLDSAVHRIYAMDAGTGGDGKVVSMADNNQLFKNGESIATLSKGERWTGPVNDFDEFSASGPIYGSVRAGGEHVMASARLKGQTFSFGNDRRSSLGVWTRALETDASCSVTTNAGTVATESISAGTGHIFSFGTPAGSDQGVVVTCDADV
ncbi:MAG: hypothetical protein ACPG1A_16610, partial [Halioglobus sp.]